MLSQIKVTGFRSLVNFTINFQPGLNVLVGPNGTGKSNFIAFLDFLSVFLERDLNNAIAVAQGAGSVFSREGFSDEEATLDFEVIGNWGKNKDSDDIPLFRNEKSTTGSYTYRAIIKYLLSVPAVYIAEEYISARTDLGEVTKLLRVTHRNDQSFRSEVKFLEMNDELKKELSFFSHRETKESSPEENIAKLLSPESSLWSFLMGSSAGLTYALLDLMSYRSVNIDPAIARSPTPVGSASQLEPTGKGLAGALYELKRGRYSPGGHRLRRMWYRTQDRQPEFESIVSWCKEVNPAIKHVDVALDFAEAQLRPSMEFHFGPHSQSFPFARISDGTVKWLTLVTILLAEPSLNIIEEPENFLHPFMQESFIALCRQVLNSDPRRVIVVSTHSPTLLDSCKPAELTMFEMVNGQSRATKVENAAELAGKIERSRFGLGHYYRIGAVYGENRSAS